MYTRLFFGMASAPLVWSRVAASANRLTQACFAPGELRIQTFVDDPIIAAAGPPETRLRNIGLVLLLWSILGLNINWKKGQLGSCVEWIGVSVALVTRADGMPAVRGELSDER